MIHVSWVYGSTGDRPRNRSTWRRLVSLELALTTISPSTDLFTKLLDVHPDGEAELVAH
ncbi:hypothetical protein ACFXKC_32625 [Streptomyces sp. NPDC059340]|uniref:hypothetical protein n=1 Tax=Streptomyces sp. NPDC059340 TaxID=3346806 RepID=UPI0036A204F6